MSTTFSVSNGKPWSAALGLVFCLGWTVFTYRSKDWMGFGLFMFVSGMWAEDLGARLRGKYPDARWQIVIWERKRS